MTTTDRDVAVIAEGLTRAQRAAMLWLPEDGSARAWEKGSEVSLYCMSKMIHGDMRKEVATIACLCESAGYTPPVKKRLYGLPLWKATPLGLAVRAHLASQERDKA